MWLKWLNPKTLIQLLSAIKALYDIAAALVKGVAGYLERRRQQKALEKSDDAVEQIDEANKIEDDEARLKEKADAACKLEQAFDPDRKC